MKCVSVWVLALALAGCADQPGSQPRDHSARNAEKDTTCVCVKARERNGWCEACSVGWVGGVKIPSAALFDTIDAHGHKILPASLRCESCQRALASDGYCERCRMGFIDGQAYLSKLAYYVGRGQTETPEARVEFLKLEAALTKLSSCERCALAEFTGGRCRLHGPRRDS